MEGDLASFFVKDLGLALAPKMCPEQLQTVAKKRYQAVGFSCNRMLKLSSSRGIRIDVSVHNANRHI